MLKRKPIYNVIGLILAVVLVIELVLLWHKFHPQQPNNPPQNMAHVVEVC